MRFGRINSFWEAESYTGAFHDGSESVSRQVLFGIVVCGFVVLNKQTSVWLELGVEFSSRDTFADCNEGCALGVTSKVQGLKLSITTLRKRCETTVGGRRLLLSGRLIAFETVDASEHVGAKVLSTRFVETSGKPSSVAKEFTWTTDEYNTQATTIATIRVIDLVVTRWRHARMSMGVHRAFLHLVEDELDWVDPPQIWKDAEAAAG